MMPFVSHAKGRMTHLLKSKSKVGVIIRERQKHDHFDFSKRPRDSIKSKSDVVHMVPQIKKPELNPKNWGQNPKDDVEMKVK